jgi:putative glutamine amidotransferase
VEANTPVFGVCLGMQQLNCFFGGRLIQDLPWHPSSPERGMPAHKVRLVDGGQEFEVNGHHHQAVLESMLAPDLRAIAFATSPKAAGFRIVEALCHKQKPIMGVQWHPEDWFDRFCDRNIRSLLSEGKPADPEKNKEKELAL